MANIVLSYRRADSRWIAGRIFDSLENHFGSGNVFMDIDNIPIGLDYRDHIRGILAKCDILVAVIGPNWAGLDTGGISRLSDEADWIRIEITSAIATKIPIVPLLVDGTPMPRADQLPGEMREFAFRQAVNLDTGVDFHNHMRRLTTSLDRLLAGTPVADTSSAPGASRDAAPKTSATPSASILLSSKWLKWALLTTAAAIVLILGWRAVMPEPKPPLSSPPLSTAPTQTARSPAPAGAFSPGDVVGHWCGRIDGRSHDVQIEKAFDGLTTVFYDNMIATRRSDNAKFIRPDNAAYWAFFERVTEDQIKGTIVTPAGITSNVIYGRCKS